MDFASIISTVNNALWATPLIALIFVGALIYCFAIKFAHISKLPLQIKLLISGDGSKDGLSAYETFCSVAAYRVAVGNIGGHYVRWPRRGILDAGHRFGDLGHRIRRKQLGSDL